MMVWGLGVGGADITYETSIVYQLLTCEKLMLQSLARRDTSYQRNSSPHKVGLKTHTLSLSHPRHTQASAR